MRSSRWSCPLPGWQAHGWLATAGFFSSLAYNSKLHVLFALLALPVLAIAFGQVRDHRPSATWALTTRRRVRARADCAAAAGGTRMGHAAFEYRQDVGTLSFVYVPATIVLCACCVWWYGGILPPASACLPRLLVFGRGPDRAPLFVRVIRSCFRSTIRWSTRRGYVLQGDVRTPDAGAILGGMLLAALKHTWLLWFGRPPLATAYQSRLDLRRGRDLACVRGPMAAGGGSPADWPCVAPVRDQQHPLWRLLAGHTGVFLDLWMFLALAILVAELIDLCGRAAQHGRGRRRCHGRLRHREEHRGGETVGMDTTFASRSTACSDGSCAGVPPAVQVKFPRLLTHHPQVEDAMCGIAGSLSPRVGRCRR